jgi:mRNA-degrading endonuclease RelE of RelBE toxin-antitoxin system
MPYRIVFLEIAEKELLKLDKELQHNISTKIIKKLAVNPKQGKHLFKDFWEIKAQNYRLYYSIKDDAIVIEKIEYEGEVTIHKIGTKDSQKRDVKSISR